MANKAIASFLQGFTPGMKASADLITNKFMSDYEDNKRLKARKDMEDYEEAKLLKRQEAERKYKEEQDRLKAEAGQKEYSDNILGYGNLFKKEYPDPEVQKKIDDAVNIVKGYKGIRSDQGYDYIKKYITPEKTEWQKQYDKPTIWEKNIYNGEMRDTKVKNDAYVPKELKRVTYKDKNGNSSTEAVYDDGSKRVISKVYDASGNRDEKEYGKSLSSLQKELDNINKDKVKWLNGGVREFLSTNRSEAEKGRINETMNRIRRDAYDLMDEEGKAVVDIHYSQIKATGKAKGMELTDFEAKEAKKLRQQLVETTEKAFKEGRIDYETSRNIIIYANSKYGHADAPSVIQ